MENENIAESVNEETAKTLGMEPNPNLSTEEDVERMDEIKQLVEAESLDTTTSMNIIINAVQVAFNSELFNDLDRYLIAKSLNTFKEYVDRGEDVVIKVG